MTTQPRPSLLAGLERAFIAKLVWAVGLYRVYLSPLRPPTCRFIPSCSQYAVDALTERGLVMGLVLSGWRLLRCGPWTKGGFDPVRPRHDHADHVQPVSVHTVHVRERRALR